MPNLSMIGPLISFLQPKQLPMGVTMTKPHPLAHPYVVNNAHSVICRTYQISAQFIGHLITF